ncbi:MAG: nucleoside hydrolase-like domain-containing protein [Candidatus Merdivicinus sp.]|jgi:hypothetical protein
MKSEQIRLLVLTDISSLKGGFKEPDDTQSLVRLLLYANDFKIEGLIATYTKHWEDSKPEYIQAIVEAYGKVCENLKKHDSRYPAAPELLSKIKRGNPHCGMDQIGEGKDTEASEWIIHTVDEPDERPIWIVVWGAPTDLAQALWKVSHQRNREETAAFLEKIRVYAIGDQYDESGPWIREQFPQLIYIMSGYGMRGMYRTGEESLVTANWLAEHICREHGSLGEAYPIYDGGDPWGRVLGVKEGDTPSFLYLIPHTPGDPMHPEWESWGGLFQQVPGTRHYLDTESRHDVRECVSKWRPDYQADFAARMDWCVQDYAHANHAPEVAIAGETWRKIVPGEEIILDAGLSSDPDGDSLNYHWKLAEKKNCGEVQMEGIFEPVLRVKILDLQYGGEIRILLTVRDNGTPSLCSSVSIILSAEC